MVCTRVTQNEFSIWFYGDELLWFEWVPGSKWRKEQSFDWSQIGDLLHVNGDMVMGKQ